MATTVILPGRDINETVLSDNVSPMPSDLVSLLAELQANSKTIVTIVPSDSEIINVDLNTRSIEIKSSAYSKFLSVARDHYAETIYFRVPRYFDGVDLMRMACVIEYTNAANESRISPILVKDNLSEPGYILLGWCIHGDATKKAGTIKFAMRFYSINLSTHEFVYSLRTQQTDGKIMYGVDEKAVKEESLFSEPLYEIVDALQQASTIYWTNV